MPKSVEEKLEHVKLKVFLYKFAPDFERDTASEKKSKSLGKLDRYKIELDETNYFWKYDITDFVAGYSFNQSIDANTFDWSMTLQDVLLTFADIDERVRVEGVKLSEDDTALRRLAQYEAQARNLGDEDYILRAKSNRGITQSDMTIRVGNNLPTKTGLLLSDIIQPYDFISCFLYKNNTPLSDLKGAIVSSTSGLKLKTFKLNDKKTGLVGRFENAFNGGKTLNSADLQKESILLSNVNGEPLFSNEFNGFVSRKTSSSNIGGVNTLTISGNGVTKLFGATRRIMKPSAMQSNIYDIGELVDPGQLVPFQNVYVNHAPSEIFADLFNIVYRVKFPMQKIKTFSIARIFKQLSDTSTSTFTVGNYYDLSSLIVGNDLQTNLFTIPPYLLSLVMKRRGFSFREPIPARQDELITSVKDRAVRKDGTIVQSDVDTALNARGNLQRIIYDKQPIYFSSELDTMRAYFKLIADVLNYFSPELRTPFEIIDEIKQKTFLEFFERPDGVIIVRAPQYNDRSSTIFSSDLEVINYTYSEQIDGLITRQKVGYGTDIIEQIESIKEYSYGNGKLLLQFGFMEAGTDPNPNVKNDKIKDNEITETKENGLAKYAEYFLRMQNASLKTGAISCNLNPKVRVGKTYFDEKAQKFGYITSVSKNVTVGGNVTMSFNLSYVRDAYLADQIQKIVSTGQTVQAQTGEVAPLGTATTFENRKNRKDPRFIVTEQLPRLVDIASEFTKSSVNKQIVDPEPSLLTFTPVS
jgi:hypothetical protein